MSTFSDRCTEGLHAHTFAEFGAAATYTAPPPAGASTAGITVLVTEDANEQKTEGSRGELSVTRLATIRVQSTDVTPAFDGQFAIGSDVWKVVNAPRLRGGRWECRCESRQVIERGSKRQRD